MVNFLKWLHHLVIEHFAVRKWYFVQNEQTFLFFVYVFCKLNCTEVVKSFIYDHTSVYFC